MVSIIAKKIAIKRQYNGSRHRKCFIFPLITLFRPALCEVFDRADITRDGTISIAEYMALCEEYGVYLDDDDIEAIQDLADKDGEVVTDTDEKYIC